VEALEIDKKKNPNLALWELNLKEKDVE